MLMLRLVLRLRLSTVDTELILEDMEASVASVRLRLRLMLKLMPRLMLMLVLMLMLMLIPRLMPMLMPRLLPRLMPRLMLRLTTDTDTEASLDMEATMEDTVTAEDTMASAGLMPNPRPQLSLSMDPKNPSLNISPSSLKQTTLQVIRKHRSPLRFVL